MSVCARVSSGCVHVCVCACVCVRVCVCVCFHVLLCMCACVRGLDLGPLTGSRDLTDWSMSVRVRVDASGLMPVRVRVSYDRGIFGCVSVSGCVRVSVCARISSG